MIKSINAVITQAAVRGPWRSEYFAGEAVFQLHGLAPHENLFRSWGRSICRAVQRVGHLDLLFDVGSLVLGCPRDDSGVAERRPQERAHREQVEDAADDGNADCDALCQEGAVESEEEPARAGDEHDGEIKDARVGRRHQVTVAIEFVSAGKHLPFSHDSLSWCHFYGHLFNVSHSEL